MIINLLLAVYLLFMPDPCGCMDCQCRDCECGSEIG